MSINISILMATHNGAKTLPRVLDAYLGLDLDRRLWNLVVVDNASTDETLNILGSYVDKLPIKFYSITERGKNIALNYGLKYASGDLFVFTDDDAVPDKLWLDELLEAAVSNVECSIFGGKIEPIWPGEIPEWIPRLVNLGAVFAITQEADHSGPISADKIWGPNMAIRRNVFDRGYRFNQSVGPSAGQYVMGSEVEFNCRLERDGYRAFFVDSAIVGHIIRPEQLDREWIVSRAYRLGRHMYHQESPLIGNDAKFFLGAPRWKYRELLNAFFERFVAVINRDFDRKFKADWEISFLRGYLGEARSMSKGLNHV